ncbi:MAG: lytic murein transglycosylase [Rhodomicrobium sp.]
MTKISRRAVLSAALAGVAASVCSGGAFAQSARLPFAQWVAAFRSRARAKGISDATYNRVMAAIEPDISVYELDREQPEFKEEVWQYLNRRVSDWRIAAGKARAEQHADVLERVERAYGVDRHIMLGLWGMETAFGDLVVNPKHMRPVFPALAALAWGEPRRRSYWEQELLNALIIVERGWASPEEMIGSWAGAMGHTQWMPEVWLNMGVDFNHDGRISPYGPPDDALAGTARYIAERGHYRRGEGWGYEVVLPRGSRVAGGTRSIASWRDRGVRRADGQPFPRPAEHARLWQPAPGGPVFLLTHNFDAIKSYNPANTYALAIAHLADRLRGEGPFVQAFPGGERLPTLAEVQEIQRRLTALGFDTDGTDGRVGKDTMRAIRNFQRKAGMTPEDGYAGLKVLARLREMS